MTRPQNESYAFEPRWAPIALLLVIAAVLETLPMRLRVLPDWVPYVAAAALFVPLLGVQLSHAALPWRRVEKVAVLLFVGFAGVVNILVLILLTRSIVYHTRDIDAIQLLMSGVAVWTINVFTFTFLYWRLDGGGPEARLAGAPRADFVFPQPSAPKGPGPDWNPAFVDYLFLAFTTATAFSPTDTLPLTPRAKVLMMIQSSVSLVAIAIVAARAVNILR